MAFSSQRVLKAYLNRFALFESSIEGFNEKEKIILNQVKGVLLSNFYDTSNAHNIALLFKGDPNPEEDFVSKVFHYGKLLGQLDEPSVAQLFSPTYIYTQTEANSPYFWFRRNSSKGYAKPNFIPHEFIEIWHETLKQLNQQGKAVSEDGSPNYLGAIKLYSELLSSRVGELEERTAPEEDSYD